MWVMFQMNIRDFPKGTEFYIKEFDVPLANIPSKGWVNFYGGVPKPYDASSMQLGSFWLAENFDEWLEVIEGSKCDN